MKKKAEKDRIRRGMNVLIATPGRLCDHLDTTLALDLSKVDYLIFDEADRMLDLDFEKKINFIIFKLHSAKKKALNEPDIPKFKLDEIILFFFIFKISILNFVNKTYSIGIEIERRSVSSFKLN
jgi:superfamily II DNA/RNA helicase